MSLRSIYIPETPSICWKAIFNISHICSHTSCIQKSYVYSGQAGQREKTYYKGEKKM
ncbi:hypothetical protein AB205_0072650, partial [Aquarana catesbeiana]